MARIPDDEIEQLKTRVSLERLAAARGVKLERHGKDLLGRCPFHDDREPSLVITPDKNLWHCLGECQTGGSVIDWVIKAEGVSFRHAVELLRADLPSLAATRATPTGSPPKRSTVAKLEAPFERSADDAVLLGRVAEYYHETLKQSPEALEYLARRGLRHPELVERFRLGHANRTLGYRLPARNRDAGAEMRGRLIALGVYRESGHEHLNGSLVVPIFDESGQVVEMYGRKIRDDLREGTPLHLYLPGPHRGVWNWEALKASRELIVCESLLDAMTFWCAGYRNVTACYGIEGFTDDHREAFVRHGIERVFIAFDRDEAGERGAEKLAAELIAGGVEAWRVVFPKGMDANEYALKLGPAEKSLGLVLRNAEWLGKGKAPERRPAIGEALEAPVVELSAAPAPECEPSALPSLAADPRLPPEARPSSDELVVSFGDRRWRVRGLSKNATPGVLRVNVLVSREGAGFHVDTLELYSARQRGAYLRQAAEELGVEERVVKRDLGELLLRLEAQQEEAARSTKEVPAVEISEAERTAALALLSDPRLVERIVEDLGKCGVVGEDTNKLVGYLAATSRKLAQPLAVVIQSASAAGKSSLMEAILRLMPDEERVAYSAMTGQSLFYMGEMHLAHKILSIAEEEGAERASYALKLLQSEGELTIASTGKDPTTGRLVTQEYHVEGPVMIFLTTTAVDVDEELLNRCVVLSVDEGREQTRAIHERQREEQTLEGLLRRQERSRLIELHQNAQRLLRPLSVVNPFARELTFLDHQTRTRRDHMKYLALISAITLLHQHQRPVKTAERGGERVSYIEATRDDIRIANRLCHEVLGKTLDELPPGTRSLLEELERMVTEGCDRFGVDRADFRFSRREVRERTGLSNTQLKVHLGRLVEMEFLAVHRGRQGQGFVYELAYAGEGRDGEAFLPGLLDLDALGTTATSRGSEDDFTGVGRPPVGTRPGVSRGDESASNAQQNSSNRDLELVTSRKSRLRTANNAAVVPAVSSLAAAAVARGARDAAAG
ncbi:MAG: toprim domain-containing protein [Polyangiaceae bacterium]|nr:toprim domain-containing protein [Polyangiaceae bacterium]